MLGLLFYGLTAPLYYGAKAVSRAGHNSRGYRPRSPVYSHGYCTIRHRSEGAAQRCAMTAAYRRVEAAAIAAEQRRAWEAAEREAARREEAAIAAAAKWAKRQRRAEAKEARRRRRGESVHVWKSWGRRVVSGASSVHVSLRTLLTGAVVVVVLLVIAALWVWV